MTKIHTYLATLNNELRSYTLRTTVLIVFVDTATMKPRNIYPCLQCVFLLAIVGVNFKKIPLQ